MLFSPARRLGSAGSTPLLLVSLLACGGGRAAAPAPGPAQMSVAERVRADSLRRPYTRADVEFMTAMIGHHQQALLMAGWAPSHEAGPAVLRLAERLVNTQQDEIATMRQWLGDRGYAAGHAGHTKHMPGMLTEAQLRALDQARGAGFDSLFLTGMIQHHRGAVTMVRGLFATEGAAQDQTVFKFANDVQVDQATEIARMEKLLATLTAETPAQ